MGIYEGLLANVRILTGNVRSVVLHRDLQGHPVWQKDYESFMKTVGFETKLCKPRHPFTKGKVERLVRFVKENFLADRVFYNVTDLNRQALEWRNTQNGIYHRAVDGVPRLPTKGEYWHSCPADVNAVFSCSMCQNRV